MDIPIRERDLVGRFRTPEGDGPFPAVLALGGSDGGTPQYFLDLLVPAGFACLALTYWGTRDTQMAFRDIPLERVERALRWLRSRSEIADRGRLAVIGASRGGELALLAASRFTDLIGPVAAYTPSAIAWFGIDPSLPPGTPCSSWAHAGVPIPYLGISADARPVQSARGMSFLPAFERSLNDTAAVARAMMPVERCAGPLLLISGGDDRVWPAGRLCELACERMARHGRAESVRHLHFASAGHMLFPYSRPNDTEVPAYPVDLGGTPEADSEAHQAAWPVVVQHLRS